MDPASELAEFLECGIELGARERRAIGVTVHCEHGAAPSKERRFFSALRQARRSVLVAPAPNPAERVRLAALIRRRALAVGVGAASALYFGAAPSELIRRVSSTDPDYRMPEADQRVRSGVLRAIIIEDRSGSVSRAARRDSWVSLPAVRYSASRLRLAAMLELGLKGRPFAILRPLNCRP